MIRITLRRVDDMVLDGSDSLEERESGVEHLQLACKGAGVTGEMMSLYVQPNGTGPGSGPPPWHRLSCYLLLAYNGRGCGTEHKIYCGAKDGQRNLT